MSGDGESFGASFLGALEGAVSVLLTLAVGYLVARKQLVDHTTVRKVSKLCSALFLPCLIIVEMGPQLTASKLTRLWILPIWGLTSTVLAHLIGWAGQRVFKTRNWVIIAAGRPNSSALPLLLLQSLESTGVLKSLAGENESAKDALSRARSLILLNVVVQQTITFQLGPSLLKKDKDKDKKANGADDVENGPGNLTPQTRPAGQIAPIVQDTERVGLLQHAVAGQSYGTTDTQPNDTYFEDAVEPIVDEPDVHWPKRLAVLEGPIKKTIGKMSPPLIGAILALFIGMIPPLHDAFYEKDSALYSSVTQSAKNLGDLFVSLQMFVVGSELGLIPNTNPGTIPTIFALIVRFLAMPGISLLFVWATAGRGWYVNDPLVWFLLILIPSGPSAMLLANVAELVNIDQGPIAGYLTISYLISPFMAVIVSLALKVVRISESRMN